MLTPRQFLAASAVVAASTASDPGAQQPVSSTAPSILFILADDLGWGDLRVAEDETENGTSG
jgi:hypothetical protein